MAQHWKFMNDFCWACRPVLCRVCTYCSGTCMQAIFLSRVLGIHILSGLLPWSRQWIKWIFWGLAAPEIEWASPLSSTKSIRYTKVNSALSTSIHKFFSLSKFKDYLFSDKLPPASYTFQCPIDKNNLLPEVGLRVLVCSLGFNLRSFRFPCKTHQIFCVIVLKSLNSD